MHTVARSVENDCVMHVTIPARYYSCNSVGGNQMVGGPEATCVGQSDSRPRAILSLSSEKGNYGTDGEWFAWRTRAKRRAAAPADGSPAFAQSAHLVREWRSGTDSRRRARGGALPGIGPRNGRQRGAERGKG